MGTNRGGDILEEPVFKTIIEPFRIKAVEPIRMTHARGARAT